MIIAKEILQTLDAMIPDKPPEMGGILGSNGQGTITDIVIDRGMESSGYHCCYSPNVTFLNQCINDWILSGKQFMGLFHTHFVGVKSLSMSDQQYITRIMLDMPDTLDELYFPVYVLPDRCLISYRAQKRDNSIKIEEDSVEIV